MDHNLEDSLNLESAIGMDFESAEDVVVSQADMSLATSNQEGDMTMEFEHIEEQHIMDSGNEEIIVSEFMGDQFNLQEYSIHDDQTSGMTTTEDSNQQSLLANQSETIDLQFEPQAITPSRRKPKYIAVKAATPFLAPKRSEIPIAPAPRQIAIAPKPPRLAPQLKQVTSQPVALVMNPSHGKKKLPITKVVKNASQPGTILAQIGKQLVMVPTSFSGQKIKLVTTGNQGMSTVQYIKADSDQAQLIPAQNISGVQTNKPVMAKVIVQGQSNVEGNQPAVITKLAPAPANACRYVMQRKTVRVSLGKDVVMASPTKQGVKYMKKQLVSFKSPQPPKIMPTPVPSTATKVMIASSAAAPMQNVILKTTAPSKMTQVTKDGKMVLQNQRSQLHQINVPGKGIQYIRLISNQNPAKTVSKPIETTKSFVISDSKGVAGQLVQVSGAKASAPPPLVLTANAALDKRESAGVAGQLVQVSGAPPPLLLTANAALDKRESAGVAGQLVQVSGAPPPLVLTANAALDKRESAGVAGQLVQVSGAPPPLVLTANAALDKRESAGVAGQLVQVSGAPPPLLLTANAALDKRESAGVAGQLVQVSGAPPPLLLTANAALDKRESAGVAGQLVQVSGAPPPLVLTANAALDKRESAGVAGQLVQVSGAPPPLVLTANAALDKRESAGVAGQLVQVSGAPPPLVLTANAALDKRESAGVAGQLVQVSGAPPPLVLTANAALDKRESAGVAGQLVQVSGAPPPLVLTANAALDKRESAGVAGQLVQVSGAPPPLLLTANAALDKRESAGVAGQLVQVSGAPPPLLLTANAALDKRPQKLVRIAAAPLTVKATLVPQACSRPSQSLLAPLPAAAPPPAEDIPADSLPSLESDPPQDLQLETMEEYEVAVSVAEAEEEVEAEVEAEAEADAVTIEEADSKAALQELIASTRDQSPEVSDNSNSMEHLVPPGRTEHPLIVISSNYMKQEPMNEHTREQDSSAQMNRSMNIETDILNTYQPPLSPPAINDDDVINEELGFKPRRACNCTKSRCLKLYCDCFANGEFCNSCNCNNCHNNLDNEELRQKAIRACLERNPNAFRPKIGKTKAGGPEIIRRHNKGCNCKRSGCLKNYCECYEAKIACTNMCKCVGCRNVEDGLQRRRAPPPALYRPPTHTHLKQPCSFMTTEVIEAVCQCLIAASMDNGERAADIEVDPVRDVIEEFSRCLQDVISASHHGAPSILDEGHT